MNCEYFQHRLLYLMDFICDDIEKLVNNVIEDSTTDPHYSAVTAQNMIVSYITVMEQLGIDVQFNDVRSYFQLMQFSDSDYELFMKKYNIESEYYIGEQLNSTGDGLRKDSKTGDGSLS